MRPFKKIFYILIALVLLLNCSGKNNYLKISVSDYQDKVYASWLGQIIGNIYGLPHENKHQAY